MASSWVLVVVVLWLGCRTNQLTLLPPLSLPRIHHGFSVSTIMILVPLKRIGFLIYTLRAGFTPGDATWSYNVPGLPKSANAGVDFVGY